MLSRLWPIRRTICEGNASGNGSGKTGRAAKLLTCHFRGAGDSLVCVMNRRKFLCSTVATAAVSAFPKILQADSIVSATAHLTIQSNQSGQPIPKNFLGLSFETAQLSDPEYFSAKNDGLAGFLRPLGQGVLRIGGNSSEYAFWTPHPAGNAASPSSAPIGPDKGHKPPQNTQTTPESIRNLRQFLDRVDWRAMYGLNFGKGTSQQAAEEAAFVSETLGDRADQLSDRQRRRPFPPQWHPSARVQL